VRLHYNLLVPSIASTPSRLAPVFVALAGLFAAPSMACGGSASPPATASPPVPMDSATEAKVRASLAGAQRTDAEKARDVHRHPLETLSFFGLRDDMTVVELSPGGGWYTSVLAPVLRERGKLIIATGDPNGDPKSEETQLAQMIAGRLHKSPDVFDKVETAVIHENAVVLGPPESASMVLTFRNFHNWVGTPWMDGLLAASFAVLKHGGVLGVTDHRARPGTAVDPKVIDQTGYVPEDYVIQTIERAGFRLAGKSEVNANPKDTKDYPKGVWTLPPTYELGQTDHAKFEAIGESDRMTLRFEKP
jgi:predicted methyltransferase